MTEQPNSAEIRWLVQHWRNGLGGGGSPLAVASEGCLFAVWQKKTQLVELEKKKKHKQKTKSRNVVFFCWL